MKEALTIDIDRGLKEEVSEVIKEIGLDFSMAVNIYFRQIAQKKKIPFELSAKRYYTPEEVMGENWENGLDEIEDEWE
jgi:DNA-damage-inducible protein J